VAVEVVEEILERIPAEEHPLVDLAYQAQGIPQVAVEEVELQQLQIQEQMA
jgi:hypothetical protein